MPSPSLWLRSGPKTCLAKTVIVVTHPSTPAHVALVTLWTGRRRETLRSARAYLWLSPKLAELAPHLSLLCLQRCQQQRSTILGHGCALLGGSSTRICRICGSKRCCQRGLHLVKRRQAATVHSFLRLHRNARQAYAQLGSRCGQRPRAYDCRPNVDSTVLDSNGCLRLTADDTRI
jgi:hypothetical protein